MISLIKLSYPLRWVDVKPWFPGRRTYQLREAFYYFLDFLIENWGYLLLNNMPFWKDYLYASAECIRQKLANLNLTLMEV